MDRRIYLDNAATSWPKPDVVLTAVDNYQRTLGVAAGRSTYQSASTVARIVDQARSALARLIGASQSDQIVFAFNGTDALNIAIHGTLNSSDTGTRHHVVTTCIEHNSVLRPISELVQRHDIEVTFVSCDDVGRVSADDIQSALQPNTRLVAISHASNVTGIIQPIEQIAQIVADHPTLLLVDAAQSLGHIPVTVSQGIDLLASSGHKGLLGPLGTGLLYVGPNATDQIRSFRQGGTGTSTEDDRQPNSLPQKLESGNLNMPGIVGLLAGINSITDQGLESIREHEVALTQQLLTALATLENVTVYGSDAATDRVGVVSFNLAGHDPHELSTLLDAIAHVETRSGLHCAPRMHQRLGTSSTNGTVRVSFGPFNTHDDVTTLVRSIQTIASS